MAVHQKSPHFLSLLLALLLFTTTLSFPMEQEADRISSLPGQPRVEFSQFSGYVTVDEVEGRALFYWLTEAVSPKEKPLVLWLNGGPGCSSIAYGASEEIGPFRIYKNGSSLYLNEYAWNREANILFLESPAGVGFSYTNTSSNLKDSGDERTARDALVFMIKWMQRFPQYQHRDFYISGESYAGHYVPQLAKKIHDYNKKHSKPFINLKGFIVGNAVMDDYNDSIGTISYFWSHALISDASYKSILNYCNFTSHGSKKKCDEAFSHVYNHEIGEINPYSIYTPTCQNPRQYTTVRFKNTEYQHLRRAISGYDPCADDYVKKYYNLREVQEALHANTTGIPYNWTTCSHVIKNWTDSPNSMLPTYKELIAAGLRIWVFSGDTDSVVPVTATRFSINHLNLTIRKRWYPWYSDNEVGGWTEVYHGLTFATVRGAGHQVPLFQPKRALTLFQSFLAGKHLPKS